VKVKAWHIIVCGKVQGVFYRKSACEQAKALGIRGWVRNLPDGSVELEIAGPENQTLTLIEWCKKGPKNAKVTQVNSVEIEEKAWIDFRIIRD
jgi:acylphosphatase